MIKFELSETQEQKLNEWIDLIIKLCGTTGGLTYKFKPNGIGESVYVHSERIDAEIDLTESEKW